jgi:hypothetical protein
MSSSYICREKLDDCAFQWIGYECHVTIYGEVSYSNSEKTLRLLLKVMPAA